MDSPRAIRLTFSYEGWSIRLVSSQKVEMTVPPSDRPGVVPETGFWYELRDDAGRTLYRRVTQNPMRFAAEVRVEDARRPLAWERIPAPRGEFVLLVPDLPEARSLVLFSSPPEAEATPKPAAEVARFALTRPPDEQQRR